MTAALPNAAGAVGLAEAGFVRKVLPTKVLSSTNMEFKGNLVRGMEGERDGAFIAGRMWSSSMYNSSGILKGANVGGVCRFAGHDIDVAVTHNKIRFEQHVQALVRVKNAVAHAEPGRRFAITIVATEAIVVPPNDDCLGRSPTAPPSRSVSQ